MVSQPSSFFIPDWPAPTSIGAAISLRSGGISKGLFSSNNMALHVGDNTADVRANRDSLISKLGLTDTPLWLNQVHGTHVIYVPDAEEIPDADGSYTDKSQTICAVMTADCLPILLCDKAGSEVAAVHAGWRGLCHGVVRQAVEKFRSPAEQIMAFLGPAIGPKAFEVGPEVLESFLDNAQSQQHQKSIITAFKSTDNNQFNDHFFANLYVLARAELVACGIDSIFGGDFCTFSDKERFYSYRREQTTGRHASLIWLK